MLAVIVLLILCFIVGLCLGPILTVVHTGWMGVQDGASVLSHLIENVLPGVALNTAVLLAGTSLGTLVLGVGLAWLVSVYEFPGRRFFETSLLLPLAFPTYVLAFVLVGIFDFTGPVQTCLRSALGGSLPWFPKIRSTGGLILVMSLGLYPYVYLLARNAFTTQGRTIFEAAQSLGFGRWRCFRSAVLPMARPWILSGLLLVLMECLADFGAVSVFNYDTYTSAIYKAWYSMFSLPAAAALASLLLIQAVLLVVFQRKLDSKGRYTAVGRHRSSARLPRAPLTGIRAILGFLIPAGVLGAGVVLPATQLLLWSVEAFMSPSVGDHGAQYLRFTGHSLLLGSLVGGLAASTSLLIVHRMRKKNAFLPPILLQAARVGYAIPGAVLAVGLFLFLTRVERAFAPWANLALNGTLGAMIIGYGVRFFSVSLNPLESASLRIAPSLEEAARSLGHSGGAILRRIEWPLLRDAFTTSAVLVFIDVIKEMPLTLMTRPFGWETLSIKIFEFTSEGDWTRAAFPSLLLVLLGLIPTAIYAREVER